MHHDRDVLYLFQFNAIRVPIPLLFCQHSLFVGDRLVALVAVANGNGTVQLAIEGGTAQVAGVVIEEALVAVEAGASVLMIEAASGGGPDSESGDNTSLEGGSNPKLDEIKLLIKNGEVKGKNIISQLDENTQIVFRNDTGVNAHPIKPKGNIIHTFE